MAESSNLQNGVSRGHHPACAPSEEQERVAASVFWEAENWSKDAVNGPFGMYKDLQRELDEAKTQIRMLEDEKKGGGGDSTLANSIPPFARNSLYGHLTSYHQRNLAIDAANSFSNTPVHHQPGMDMRRIQVPGGYSSSSNTSQLDGFRRCPPIPFHQQSQLQIQEHNPNPRYYQGEEFFRVDNNLKQNLEDQQGAGNRRITYSSPIPDEHLCLASNEQCYQPPLSPVVSCQALPRYEEVL